MADDDGVPLTTLLSQTLVAFTIALDNEFERQLPHRTTSHGATATERNAPWLVSLAMWANCMRHVGADGITAPELARRARASTNLQGMRRWGYITVEGTQGQRAIVRPTRAGTRAQEVWRPLAGAIEARWREQLGDAEIERLRNSLVVVARQLEPTLPDYLPILGHGLFSKTGLVPDAVPPVEDVGELPLYALLSRVLLAYAVAYERESELSLAIAADVLRVLDDEGVQLRDLPHLSGVSKQAVAMALGILEKRRLAVVEPGPSGGRFKVAVLTETGQVAQAAHRDRLADVEARARTRLGEEAIGELRQSLEPLALGDLNLFDEGWRASQPMPAELPHYPMVLHRGGFPDGS